MADSRVSLCPVAAETARRLSAMVGDSWPMMLGQRAQSQAFTNKLLVRRVNIVGIASIDGYRQAGIPDFSNRHRLRLAIKAKVRGRSNFVIMVRVMR